MASEPEFEELDHTADWAYRVRAPDLPGLFARAASGLYRLAGITLQTGPRQTRDVRLDAVDAESLLVGFLNELLFLTESEALGFDEFEIVSLSPTHIHARARGGHMATWDKYVKAVTYNDLEIRRSGTGYEVTIVLDV